MKPTAAAALFATDHLPLAAAFAAAEALFPPEPVPAVSMNAEGRLVIVGEAGVALGWAERLAGQREVTVLAIGTGAELPEAAEFVLETGDQLALSGHLGAFVLRWQAAGVAKQASFDAVLDLSPQALLNRVELPKAMPRRAVIRLIRRWRLSTCSASTANSKSRATLPSMNGSAPTAVR
ncbi:hypothetical protein [Dechloromonas sp. A34]|uniref:hypothetical protein n=1 Tax=Dechloromonas sp. A34 TaxID=447588 RepID=UPI0022489B5A|nr:hypothetical protein [Dechloromonas sp. A34]